jgi:alkylation response protein AidB-like acyl-CoA dehydrogenase
MDFSLNEVQQMLQDSVRRFVEKTYSFEKRGALLQSGSAESAENWRTVADNGWVGVAIPESEGGFGGSVVETALVAREFGRGLVLEPYLGCAVLGLQTLYACPSSKVREELLPQLIEGSRKLALAYAESESYGMPLPPTLTATQVAGGFQLAPRSGRRAGRPVHCLGSSIRKRRGGRHGSLSRVCRRAGPSPKNVATA